jgi:hypothetical protein
VCAFGHSWFMSLRFILCVLCVIAHCGARASAPVRRSGCSVIGGVGARPHTCIWLTIMVLKGRKGKAETHPRCTFSDKLSFEISYHEFEDTHIHTDTPHHRGHGQHGPPQIGVRSGAT